MIVVKYRAWEPGAAEMLHPHHLDGHAHKYNLHKLVLLQSTRLLDVKGEEIFEGDVCRHMVGKQWKVGVVVQRSGSSGFNLCYFCKDTVNHPHNIKHFPFPHFLTRGEAITTEIEVIGNIYENTDLLG